MAGGRAGKKVEPEPAAPTEESEARKAKRYNFMTSVAQSSIIYIKRGNRSARDLRNGMLMYSV